MVTSGFKSLGSDCYNSTAALLAASSAAEIVAKGCLIKTGEVNSTPAESTYLSPATATATRACKLIFTDLDIQFLETLTFEIQSTPDSANFEITLLGSILANFSPGLISAIFNTWAVISALGDPVTETFFTVKILVQPKRNAKVAIINIEIPNTSSFLCFLEGTVESFLKFFQN